VVNLLMSPVATRVASRTNSNRGPEKYRHA
jgi:hypothetical protein